VKTRRLANGHSALHIGAMIKSDVTCPSCRAGYRRVELHSLGGCRGDYRCLTCGEVLEVFDGKTEVAYRLTVSPEKSFK
jgi:predicted Zn finger-like uncharacterized protein